MAQTGPRHIIFIGETGSGKSSVINLIADNNRAAVSPDATPCTSTFTAYDVTIEPGRTYRLWDTPGLNEPSRLGRLFRRNTPVSDSLRRFLKERHRRGELDLLVLCVRGNRAHRTISNTYTSFCRTTRRIAPVVIAVTHLEGQQPAMEVWWQVNERELANLGLIFDGHACITCLSPHHRRWASQQDVRHLISAEYQQPVWSVESGVEYLRDPNNCVVC